MSLAERVPSHEGGEIHNLRAGLVLRAEIARQDAAVHEAACRYRRQGLRCSSCQETQDRAARLARLAGEARPGCQYCGDPHGVSVPCGFRREGERA